MTPGPFFAAARGPGQTCMFCNGYKPIVDAVVDAAKILCGEMAPFRLHTPTGPYKPGRHPSAAPV